MKIFSFSLLLFNIIFLVLNQFIKDNNQRNLSDKKNIIEMTINSASGGDVTFIAYYKLNDDFKIYVNDVEIPVSNTIKTEPNINYNITIQFPTNFEDSCQDMFYGLNAIKTIKFINFNGCKDTIKMFYECSSLESIDLSSFNTSLVTYMEAMFYGCSSLEYLNLSSFDTSLIDIMDSMFEKCSSLEILDLSSFNTSLFYNMNYAFNGCYSLIDLFLSNSFTMENVKYFAKCFLIIMLI